MARFRWISVLASASLVAAAVVIALTPRPALAAGVVVTPKAEAHIELAFSSCSEFVFVYTEASFSPQAREDEVYVSFTSGPPGKSDSHAFPGGTKKDDFSFYWPVSAFSAGASVGVEVKWQAHNGNALSMGYGTATASVDIPSAGYPHKLSTAAKCKSEEQSKDYAATAARQRANAARARDAGNTPGAVVWDNLAASNDLLADKFHKIALDPPDPNFTTLPTATPPSLPPIVAGAGVSADAATALNDLQHLQADCVGQAAAALTAMQRAQGARQAGDATWEKNQSLATADFLKALAGKLSGLPTAMQTAGSRLQAGGFANPTITPADRTGAVEAYLASGLSNVDILHQAGLTDADLPILGGLMGTAIAGNTASEPAMAAFTPPDFAQHINDFVATLNTDAAALVANPLVDYNDQTVEPSPSPSVEPTPSPTTPEGASLLGDSGFEEPLVAKGDSYETLKAGTALGAWTIEKGSVDVVAASGGTAATGGQFVDLNGNATPDAGVISQKVHVNGGHKYRLTFQLAGNPNGDPPIKTVDVSLGDKTKSFSFNIKGHTNAKLGWTSYTLENSACGDSTMTVRFASTTKGQRGPNLDNVMLTDLGSSFCIPLWLMIAGGVVVLGIVAVVAWFWWRRRRSSTPATTETPTETPAETPALIES